MKAAVVNMETKFADVRANMEYAEKMISTAAKKQAEIIVFPEFFTTGFAVNNALVPAIVQSGKVPEDLAELSKEYGIAVCGSYLWYDRDKKEVLNTFGLFFPTGEAYFHSKDIPTALENFCYAPGDELSVFETPLGRIGVAMCWEQIRYATVRRMAGKVDFVIAGSCWWDFTPEDGAALYERLSPINRMLAEQAPVKLSEILGVPVIHASHAAAFKGLSMGEQPVSCERPIRSKTMIIGADGKEGCLEQKEAGCLCAEIQPGAVCEAVEIPEDRYWIPELPTALEDGFWMLNEQYHKVYEEKIRPLVRKSEEELY